MSHGKYARNGKEDKKAKLLKNRLEREVEQEKQNFDEAKSLEKDFANTGEAKIDTDKNYSSSSYSDSKYSNKELTMKEKIYKSLEESTNQIEQEVSNEVEDTRYNNLVDRIDELEDDRIRKKIDRLAGFTNDDDDEDIDDDDEEFNEDEDKDIKELRKRAKKYNKAKKKKEKLEEKAQEKMARKKKKGKNKGLKIFALVLVLLIAAFCAFAYWFINGKFDKLNYEEIDTTQIGISQTADEQLKGYRTVAIFGVDSRTDDYDDQDNRSDSIILVTLNQDTDEVTMVSVYRDTYIDVDEGNYTRLDKVNHAFVYGGMQNSLKSINNALDLNIREYVAVNFFALIDAVDTLGGLDLNITAEEKSVMNKEYIPYINQYIRNERPDLEEGDYITEVGTQHVNGAQVLAYCRIRYTSGGDYKRTERMRTVIEMLLSKVKKLSLFELNDLVDTMLPQVKTNIKKTDILSLVPKAFSVKITQNSVGWPYTLSGWTDDVWYAVPCTLRSNVIDLHKNVYGDNDYEPSDTVIDMSDRIRRKTGLDESDGEDSNEFSHVEQDIENQ